MFFYSYFSGHGRVFQIIVGTDFTGSWAVISQHRGHPFLGR